jgi:hypothetical protein
MIKLLFALATTLFLFNDSQKIEWDATYTQATYALNHTKKALKSNNFDHQRHYSEKALEAYDKINNYLEACSDDELKLKIKNSINDLEHAVDAPDWDRGRFYSKRVYQNTQDLITTLDIRAEEENLLKKTTKNDVEIIE